MAQSAISSGGGNGKQRWLILFNCQATGLANCITLLNPDVEVDAYDPPAYTKESAAITARWDDYDLIVVAPNIEKNLGLELGDGDRVCRLPTFNFTGFHPDHCNLIVDDSWTGGPLSGNFSALSYAAFAHGLAPRQAVDLHRDDVYRQVGYFNQWPALRTEFVARFANFGFDVSRLVVEWSRMPGGFAYVPSHPKMACLKGIAAMLLERRGLPAHHTDLLPHDNLANGVVFPVYPGIGSPLGISGSYQFKPPRQYRYFGLEEFVEQSFAFFQQSKSIVVPAPWQSLIARIRLTIEGST